MGRVEADPTEVSESIDTLIELIEQVEAGPDGPPSRQEFLDSVREGAVDMQERVNDRDQASLAQERAVENWTESVSRWLSDG